jgi:hypothetical protein
MIEFDCSECGKHFKVRDDFAGKHTKCSQCGHALQVPSSGPPELISRPNQDRAEILPDTHRELLAPGEKAIHFEWLDTTGGCGSTVAAKHFMLITDRRVIYDAVSRDAGLTYARTSGSISLSKISFVGTTIADGGCNQSAQVGRGCNPQQACVLRVGTGGGSVLFPFFNEQKAKRVQRVIEEIVIR